MQMAQIGEPYEKPVDLWCRHAPHEKAVRPLHTLDGKESTEYALVYCNQCKRGEIVAIVRDAGLR